MTVQSWTFLLVATSFALYIFIAILLPRGIDARVLRRRSDGVSPLANGMATAADWMSRCLVPVDGGAHFVHRATMAPSTSWVGRAATCCLRCFLAPYLRKFGSVHGAGLHRRPLLLTDVARIVAVVCAILRVLHVCRRTDARRRDCFQPLPRGRRSTTGVMIGMGVVFFYAVLGGMKGITYTQVAQYCVLIFAYLVPAIFLSIHDDGESRCRNWVSAERISRPEPRLLDKL